ncbi:MAG: flagellar export chaperone FlgN [Phycisphaerales bacterium]|nr:flagellar export chaperone FlgN [Phycisphaerales bacterium]
MSQASPSSLEIDPAIGELESLLETLTARIGELVELASTRLDAIRGASPAELAQCIGRENQVVQAIAELEKRRVRVVGELAERFGSRAGVNTTWSWLADRIGGAPGERLRTLARSLRERMEMLTRLNETAALATRALISHMQGLMSQVGARLSHSRTYARSGAVLPGPAIMSSVDVTS